MAQLRDTVVTGSLRVTDTLYSTTALFTILNAPTSSNGTTFGPGSADQVLKSNGTSIYWGTDTNSVTGVKGNAETNYRTGNVNITPTNIGLGNVTNDALVKASLGSALGDMLYWSAASTPARLAKGSANTILTASGTSLNPAWTGTAATVTSATSTTKDTAAYATLTLGNNANVNTTTAHSEGSIVLYSAATAAHTIKGASTTNAYTSTLPNKTGILVTLDGSPSANVGSGTKPVYVTKDGVVTAASNYAGGTLVTLNGTSKGASTASFYAPTGAGTAGYFLKSTAGTPEWSTDFTGNELVWYAGSSTSTYYYITTDIKVTNEKWIYGQIMCTRAHNLGNALVMYSIHTTSAGAIDYVWFDDLTKTHIGNFRAHKLADNTIIISLTTNNRYSRMRMRTYLDNSGSYYNYARSVSTTAPTVSSTVVGYRELSRTIVAHEIYWGGTWNSQTGNPGIVQQTTDGNRGILAFKYTSGTFTNKSFGIQLNAVIIETTKNGSSWTTLPESAVMYTADFRRRLFNFRERVIPVHGLDALDYYNNTAGVAYTASNGETHYAPPTVVGSGVRITVDFTKNLRYFNFDTIEVRWYAVPDTCECTIESYNIANNAWTVLFTGSYTNTDTRRFYKLGRNPYVRGNRNTNTTDIAKLRFTLKITTKNTSHDNRRYAPGIVGINLYGVGVPSVNSNTETRFAAAMCQRGIPLYVTDYDLCGAARIPTGGLYIGDDLKNTAANTEKWTNVYIGNSADIAAENVHSQGRIYLYSAATKAHVLVGASTTTEYTHTFQNATGTIAHLNSNITGTAANVTGTVTVAHGGTNTTTVTKFGVPYGNSSANAYAFTAAGGSGAVFIGQGGSTAPAWYTGLTLTGTKAADWKAAFAGTTAATSKTTGAVTIAGGLGVSGNIYGNKVYNAIWNDYAEYRECDLLPPGTCVLENDNGHLTITKFRLIPGAAIITDTFGYAEGETETAQTPIAVAGRVLAYTYRPRQEYHAGMAVCSAPGGTVDIMTRDEIKEYPDAIIGIVSEIPDYKIWGSGDIEVNDRIWIKVR